MYPCRSSSSASSGPAAPVAKAKPNQFERFDSSDSSGLIIDEAENDAGNVKDEGDAYNLNDSFINDNDQGEEEEGGEEEGESKKDEEPMETDSSEVQPGTSTAAGTSTAVADFDGNSGVTDPTPKKKHRKKNGPVETPRGIEEQFRKVYRVSNDVLFYAYKTCTFSLLNLTIFYSNPSLPPVTSLAH